MSKFVKVLAGDCLESMQRIQDKSINCCVTSPPYYGLRSYLPGKVKLKQDAPEWVKQELVNLGIIHNT